MQSLYERFNNALEFERNGEYVLALREYGTIISEKSDFREAYLNLGSLYARLEKYTEAMKCYEGAVALGEDALVFFNIGSIYYKMGEYKKAIIQLDKSRRIDGSFVSTSLVMGLCFSRLKNTKAAEGCFKNVCALNPDNPVAMIALAILYFETGRFESALKIIERILARDGNNQNVRKLRARVLQSLNRSDEYRQEVKVIKNTSPRFQLYDRFIQSIPVEVFTDRYGTIDEKLERLEKKARDNNDPEALISASLCCLFKGDTDRAIDFLFEARDLALN
ncbi:MAG TPA: tetratricopeptide repeat protein [Spirochaetota bacterium]|nr:tetratricopeptide repeat protein [Spirochaetota bacterium]HQP47850.1 tetratricopeptide repeat protein [Spirochaetota bacterium]